MINILLHYLYFVPPFLLGGGVKIVRFLIMES
jgi:hypothetical protein